MKQTNHKPTTIQTIAAQKMESRRLDRIAVAQGRGEEIQSRNSLLPQEIVTDPNWKKSTLEKILKNRRAPRTLGIMLPGSVLKKLEDNHGRG